LRTRHEGCHNFTDADLPLRFLCDKESHGLAVNHPVEALHWLAADDIVERSERILENLHCSGAYGITEGRGAFRANDYSSFPQVLSGMIHSTNVPH